MYCLYIVYITLVSINIHFPPFYKVFSSDLDAAIWQLWYFKVWFVAGYKESERIFLYSFDELLGITWPRNPLLCEVVFILNSNL